MSAAHRDRPPNVAARAGGYLPPSITGIQETGLSQLWLQDLALKILYFRGYLNGSQIAEAIALPFAGIVEPILDNLKHETLVETKTSPRGVGKGSYVYAITNAGSTRAQEALARSQYAGPAPVPLEAYNQAITHQARRRTTVTSRSMRKALAELVLAEETFHQVGPAVNSGTSIFIYGPPGDGKTSIAQAIGKMIQKESIYIPSALYIDGHVVKLYDSVNHELWPSDDTTEEGTGAPQAGTRRDPRWVRIRRPFIMVGGELTLTGLDLVLNDTIKYYEAPFQVKANGGILLIDDFGRQLVHPRDLLNRWIVPLENRIDYLTLHTGHKVEVPFDVLVIFSTNLPPRELVDEGFLRRLRHKIEVRDPSFKDYRVIFQREAAEKGIPYSDPGLAHLLKEWYVKPGRKLRASHPRDLCEQILDIASYLAIEPNMEPELLDTAAKAYFVEL